MAVFLIVSFDIFLFVRGDWYSHWSIDWRHYSLELQVNLSRIAFSFAEINRTWYKLVVACLYSQESVLFVLRCDVYILLLVFMVFIFPSL